MLHQISLREANQHFSHYISEVEQGSEIIITRRGQPIVKLSPIAKKRKLTASQQKTWNQLLTQLRKGYSLGKEKFDREQLHER
jgi:prevent-host-death family protein